MLEQGWCSLSLFCLSRSARHLHPEQHQHEQHKYVQLCLDFYYFQADVDQLLANEYRCFLPTPLTSWCFCFVLFVPLPSQHPDVYVWNEHIVLQR